MNYSYIKARRTNGENKFNQNKKHLFYEKNKFYGFKKISEERKKEIEEIAHFWANQNQKLNPNQKLFALYNLLNKPFEIKMVPKLQANDECFLFLISAFDPELKLLQISLEESKVEEIKRRFTEEFQVFYDSRLLQIEIYYNKRFPTLTDEFDKKL